MTIMLEPNTPASAEKAILLLSDDHTAGLSFNPPVTEAVKLVRGVTPEPSKFIPQIFGSLFVFVLLLLSRARDEVKANLNPLADHTGSKLSAPRTVSPVNGTASKPWVSQMLWICVLALLLSRARFELKAMAARLPTFRRPPHPPPLKAF